MWRSWWTKLVYSHHRKLKLACSTSVYTTSHRLLFTFTFGCEIFPWPLKWFSRTLQIRANLWRRWWNKATWNEGKKWWVRAIETATNFFQLFDRRSYLSDMQINIRQSGISFAVVSEENKQKHEAHDAFTLQNICTLIHWSVDFYVCNVNWSQTYFFSANIIAGQCATFFRFFNIFFCQKLVLNSLSSLNYARFWWLKSN